MNFSVKPTKKTGKIRQNDTIIVEKAKLIGNTAGVAINGQCKAVVVGTVAVVNAARSVVNKLKELGFDCGEVDGIFGQNTLKAVMDFQTANGLTVDGIVGPQTWGALL